MTLTVAVDHRLGDFQLAVDFTAGSGLTALFGRSGAGKTSLINVIAGLIRPDRGHVEIDGDVLTDTATRRFVPPHRRRIGYVFQEGRLFPHLNVRRNLLYGARFAKGPKNTGEFDQIVALLGIGDLLTRRPGEFVGRREAARGDRTGASGAAAHSRDGRAARLARRGAQGRNPPL